MIDKTSVIFGNQIDKKTIKSAEKSKQKYIKKFGDDSEKDYKIGFAEIPTLDYIKTKNIVFKDENEKWFIDEEMPILMGEGREYIESRIIFED